MIRISHRYASWAFPSRNSNIKTILLKTEDFHLIWEIFMTFWIRFLDDLLRVLLTSPLGPATRRCDFCHSVVREVLRVLEAGHRTDIFRVGEWPVPPKRQEIWYPCQDSQEIGTSGSHQLKCSNEIRSGLRTGMLHENTGARWFQRLTCKSTFGMWIGQEHILRFGQVVCWMGCCEPVAGSSRCSSQKYQMTSFQWLSDKSCLQCWSNGQAVDHAGDPDQSPWVENQPSQGADLPKSATLQTAHSAKSGGSSVPQTQVATNQKSTVRKKHGSGSLRTCRTKRSL